MRSVLKSIARTLLPDSSYHRLAARAQRKRDIRQFNTWSEADESRMKFYGQFVSKGSLVFDVGANMGNRSKIFHKLGAVVVAFEPQDACADFLSSVFPATAPFHLVRKALGAAPGEAEMLISSDHTISSLSADWVSSVEKAGRFAEDNPSWNLRKMVQIDTLDHYISVYGLPGFVKIDVEGFEDKVLAGLHQPVAALSLEFTPEYLDSAYRCIDHLCELAPYRFQISLGESMNFHLPDWVNAKTLKEALLKVPGSAFGDIYGRFDAAGHNSGEG